MRLEFTLANWKLKIHLSLYFIIPHTYEKWKRFVEHLFLIKKNCYVSASAHLTQQFSCINNVKVNRYIVYCPKQFIRQSLLFLHKLRKHRRTYNSQKTGNCDCKTAHGTFYFTQFHCLGSTDGMGRSSIC